MAISEKNDRQAPDRVFIAWPNDNGCGLAFTVPSKAGQTRTEFVRADLAAPSAKGDLTEWDREPFPPREIMVQMLTTAIATNWNDDRSEPQTEKRRRAIDRSEAMAMALAYIEQNEAAPSAPAEIERLVGDPDTEIGGYAAYTTASGDVWVHSSALSDQREALTAERDQARAEAAAIRFSREHHKDRANRAKERMGNLRKRKAALMSALNEVLASNDLANAKFTASVALGGWEDDVILFRARSLATEPGTTALAEMLDAETRKCSETIRPRLGPQGNGVVVAELHRQADAILARIDQRKGVGE